jgi:hypothetical protein
VVAAGMMLPGQHRPNRHQALPPIPQPRVPSSAPSHRPPPLPSHPAPSRSARPPAAAPAGPTVAPVVRHTKRRTRWRIAPQPRPPRGGTLPPGQPVPPPGISPATCGLHLDLAVIRLDLQAEAGHQGLLCHRSR